MSEQWVAYKPLPQRFDRLSLSSPLMPLDSLICVIAACREYTLGGLQADAPLLRQNFFSPLTR
jgi:hypothetical protein